MKLTPFKPKDLWLDHFDSIENFRNDINKLFSPLSRWMGRDAGLFEREWKPSIDVYDSDNDILVNVDMPGMKKEEIDVSIHGDLLTIKGEKKRENEVRKEDYCRSERFYGSFNRTIQLPSEVEQDKVSATYKDGVLELKLPKREGAKTKRIQVDVK